jgi:hypothetical protein
MTIGLRIFADAPFGEGTLIDLVDTFEGDGINDTFTLVNLSGLLVGAVAFIDATVLIRGVGFEVVDDTVVFTAVPANGSIIVVPGVSSVNYLVQDRTGANTQTLQLYFLDPDEISTKIYENHSEETDILISAVDLIGSGAEVDWIEFAPQLGDGTAGTYEAAGDPLVLADISVGDTLQDVNTGDDIEVTDGADWEEGWMININPGEANNEIVRIVSIAANIITTSGLSESHLAAEPIYHCGYGFFARLTVPDEATGYNAARLGNISYSPKYAEDVR